MSTKSAVTAGIVAIAVGSLLSIRPQAQQAATVSIRVLSSPADMVSGGDALIEVHAANPSSLTVRADGRDVSPAFHPGQAPNSMIGLVEGLREGKTVLQATAGGASASLEVTNYPISGPILSGPALTPYVCMTQQAGLGESLDAKCSAQAKFEYFYKGRGPAGEFKALKDLTTLPNDVVQATTSTGQRVPYIVRVETGTIDRAIYRIAILDDPRQSSAQRWKPGPGWNNRVVYSFGGGCGTNYNQGRSSANDVLSDLFLSRGYAHITSTANVMGQFCNDVLSGEVVMMVKEHFIERYGIPAWTVGSGGSGGSMQQFLIAQNFPGLLDGLMPTRSFPDLLSMWNDYGDCRLFNKYFANSGSSGWTDVQRQAVEGQHAGTCQSVDNYVGTIVANNARGCGIPADQVYDADRNPHGARCTIWDVNANTYGRDPATGAGRRTLDNVGVQYGLVALNAGTIAKALFLDLNAKMGGFDNDGNIRDARSVADPEAVRLAYAAGRINLGAGSLGQIPIISFRAYLDDRSDVHDRVRDFIIRRRLERANGRSDNFVSWLAPSGPMLDVEELLTLDTMSTWLDAIVADHSTDPAIVKVVRAKPARAVDACWDKDATRVDEPFVFGNPASKCGKVFPVYSTPRLVAGQPLASDVLKCQLKPARRADYKVTFTDSEWQELTRIFPTGVCDYAKPSVNAGPVQGVYQHLPLATPAQSARASMR
jgi:Tannase-like family of unknown function (DUF6351)